MKIIQYCQHVLGIGHLFRSLEISRALSGHEVILVTGGPQIATDAAKHVREVHLPHLQMNREFKGLFSTQENVTLDQIKAERQKCLFTLFEKEKPDVFLIQLYPFGRKAFGFELDPVLQALDEKRLPGCSVVCSVRDILVEKEDRDKHESRVVETLNRYFDAVLVHADPKLVEISETFDHFDEINIPVDYTGYIAPKLLAGAGQKIRNQLKIGDNEILIVASAGGGNVGAPVLQAAVRAFCRLETRSPCHLKVFSGPFLDQSEFELLKKAAGDKVQVERFTNGFFVLSGGGRFVPQHGRVQYDDEHPGSGVPALVWPFPQNREQRLRAGRLADLGVIGVLADEDLRPDRLAGMMAMMDL